MNILILVILLHLIKMIPPFRNFLINLNLLKCNQLISLMKIKLIRIYSIAAPRIQIIRILLSIIIILIIIFLQFKARNRKIWILMNLLSPNMILLIFVYQNFLTYIRNKLIIQLYIFLED